MSNWEAAFATQAQACRTLASNLTADICEAFSRVIARSKSPLARQVRNWPGDASYHGDSIPLRLCGALQGLVLTQRTEAFETGQDLEGKITYEIQNYESWFLEWIQHAPQTNEVGRSAVLIAGTSFLANLCAARFDILELGASAGLNLNFHLYQIDSDDNYHPFSQSNPKVLLRPEWRRGHPFIRPLAIGATRGVDLNPLDPKTDGLRLMAYIWPDQPQRLERMRAALAIAREHPPQVDRGDAAEWLEAQLDAPPRQGRLVYHTVAAQYFPTDTRDRVEAALQSAGSQASADKALAHLSMEGDGRTGMILRLRLWAGEGLREWDLGRAHAHAQWIDWQPKETT